MRQVEFAKTITFTAPRHARAFFEALAADNLDLGRPDNMEIIFNRQVRCVTKGVFRTAVDRDNDGVVLNAFYRHSRVKTYLKDGRALRVETVVNAPEKAHTFEATCARRRLKFTGLPGGCPGPGRPRREGCRPRPCRALRTRAWGPGWRRDRRGGLPPASRVPCRPGPARGRGTGRRPGCCGSWWGWWRSRAGWGCRAARGGPGIAAAPARSPGRGGPGAGRARGGRYARAGRRRGA